MTYGARLPIRMAERFIEKELSAKFDFEVFSFLFLRLRSKRKHSKQHEECTQNPNHMATGKLAHETKVGIRKSCSNGSMIFIYIRRYVLHDTAT